MTLRKPSARTASLGVTHARLAIESELGWLFREQPTEDYGIDAQVEVVDGETVRGKLLAVQIKSGDSLFREPGPGGWWFRPDDAHARYWLDHSLPVAVILYHPKTHRCHWELVNKDTLIRTSKGGWKLLVPAAHVLDRNSQASLREAAEGYPLVIRVREVAEQPSRLSGLVETHVAHDDKLVSSEPKYVFGDTFEITPHPRLLGVLGDVIISPWACVAEMVDLAYCSTLDTSLETQKLTVAITLPSSINGDDRDLVIRDDGIGMEPEWLLTAVREGFKGAVGERNFGILMMSLKLGHRLVIRTTRTGDLSWAELSYGLAGTDAFIARACRLAKKEPTEHGTEIIISDLRSDLKTSLERKHQAIRERLSECYSYLLREDKLEVIFNGQPVTRRRPCIWDASRAVMVNGVPISAVQEISQVLPPAWVCRSCGFQHRAAVDVCAECQSQDVFERSRQVWGWLGVQRYLHVSDFGIDFLRNGRKILSRDKTIFTWRESWDSQSVPEYPVDMPMAGRIVGEIHCDHVPVNYVKEAFEYESLDWQEVVRVIRGSGPLGAVKSKTYGYPINDSPLAQIVRAFRRNDPGLRYLTPGDGMHAIHEKTRMWAAWFHEGRPEFQADQIWYDAALSHDERKMFM